MDAELAEFKSWLKKNKFTLSAYAPDEIAYFAMMNGFSVNVACAEVTNQVVHLKRLLTMYESPLFGQWTLLRMYEHGHDDLELAA